MDERGSWDGPDRPLQEGRGRARFWIVRMEFLVILRTLGRQRILVATGAVVAIVVGLHIAGRVSLWPPGVISPQRVSGTATTRVLIDRPNSLLDDSAPEVGDPVATRAILMANLMTSAPVKRAISRDAGLPAGRVTVIGPAAEGPAAVSPLAERAFTAEATSPNPNVIRVSADGQLPIVTISANATGAGRAAKLVTAAMNSLDSLAAATQHGAGGRVVVTPLGTPRVREITRRPQPALAVAAAIAVFGLWCMFSVVGVGVSRAWRRT
jgi:hypothetical protein